MNNYEYIIASLPDLTLQAFGPAVQQTNGQTQGPDVDAIVEEIREQLAGGFAPTHGSDRTSGSDLADSDRTSGKASGSGKAGNSDRASDRTGDREQAGGSNLASSDRTSGSDRAGSGKAGNSDIAALQKILDGFESGKLTPAFYADALSSRQDFIREYFRFDLNVRNTKVAYLNEALGRPEGTDIMFPCGDCEGAAPGTVTSKPDGCTYEPGNYDEEPEVSNVLKGSDILERERGLDKIMWAKVEELTNLHIFDLDIILGFIVRLKIIDRWLRLDPETGRELFGRLVAEIRSGSPTAESVAKKAGSGTAAMKE